VEKEAWVEILLRRIAVVKRIYGSPPTSQQGNRSFSRYVVEKTRRILDANPGFGIQNPVESALIFQHGKPFYGSGSFSVSWSLLLM